MNHSKEKETRMEAKRRGGKKTKNEREKVKKNEKWKKKNRKQSSKILGKKEIKKDQNEIYIETKEKKEN